MEFVVYLVMMMNRLSSAVLVREVFTLTVLNLTESRPELETGNGSVKTAQKGSTIKGRLPPTIILYKAVNTCYLLSLNILITSDKKSLKKLFIFE